MVAHPKKILKTSARAENSIERKNEMKENKGKFIYALNEHTRYEFKRAGLKEVGWLGTYVSFLASSVKNFDELVKDRDWDWDIDMKYAFGNTLSFESGGDLDN
jgi:hypothetical protein